MRRPASRRCRSRSGWCPLVRLGSTLTPEVGAHDLDRYEASDIDVGDADAHPRDVLGRGYNYFDSQVASAEGKRGGNLYTSRCLVMLLVEAPNHYRGR